MPTSQRKPLIITTVLGAGLVSLWLLVVLLRPHPPESSPSTQVTKLTRRILTQTITPSPTITPTPTPAKVTLALTGVTAISRGVEDAIERTGDPLYPARAVMETLSRVDLTHVDSENPFFDECQPRRHGLILCGKTRSIAALKAIGTDIVDLTGNHQNDYGPEKNLESIRHLEEAGFKYFGGGKNEADAQKILYQTVKGTTFAFLGYAYFDSLNGPSYRSLAYRDRPGANFYSEEKMLRDVANARQKADVVIVDYQFIEEYQYEPLPIQREVFRKTADAGADIVVGVQSHQPQEIEIYKPQPAGGQEKESTSAPRESLLFYGLGNFFFDQMWSHPTRQGIIPIITLENGRITDVKIKTTLLYDYAQPRFTQGAEREELLKKILPKDWPYSNPYSNP